jgi:hypothetical protein
VAETFLLPHPWNLLILTHGKTISFRVTHWLQGLIEIQPKDSPVKKTIPVLRVWPSDTGRERHEDWWDITYTQLREAILPWLENPQTSASKFTIQANAHGQRKNFTITVNP